MDATEPAPGANAVESAKKQWQVSTRAMERTFTRGYAHQSSLSSFPVTLLMLGPVTVTTRMQHAFLLGSALLARRNFSAHTYAHTHTHTHTWLPVELIQVFQAALGAQPAQAHHENNKTPTLTLLCCYDTDRTTPHTLRRWMSTFVLFLVFFGRILWAQAYYIVCYALGIYLLNLFLAFLQPKFDPSVPDIAESDIADGAPGLPTSMSAAQAQSSALNGTTDSGEFRPFIRRLPEFKFWYSATKAIAFSLLATCFPLFDVPVFWPILLVYFCVLFFITMRRQIGHMRKYKYLPWDLGKTSYGNN